MNPFAALRLPARPDLTDDQVRAAWRAIAAQTHPDRRDGGNPSAYSAAAAAYAQLRTPWGRSEALADLAAAYIPAPQPPAPGPAGTLRRAVAVLPARVWHGRPLRLAARALTATAIAFTALTVIPGTASAPAVVAGSAPADRPQRTRPMTTPARCARELAAFLHGPHDDRATADAAALAAETIRYLNYAASHGGLTDLATVYALTAELSAAAYRLPQLLARLTDWLDAETRAGRIADDCHRPARQITDDTASTLALAAQHAGHLARALAAAQNLTGTLHPADPEHQP